MKIRILFLLLLAQFMTNAQNLKYLKESADKLLKINNNVINKNITSEYKDLIGKTILSDKNYNNFYEKILFVNDKYFLKIKGGRKILGHYKVINIKGIPAILLFNQNRDDKALIFALKGKKEYLINWQDSSGNNFNDIANLTEESFKNQELLVDREIIHELNFHNPNISFYVKNKKIGIKLKERKLIKNECDSLYIYGKMATIFNSKKICLYNLKGKVLEENLKADYSYSQDEHQIIDSKNKMYFINTLGFKYNKPKKTHLRLGNDFYKQKTFITYYAYKNKILKTTIFCSPKFKKDSVRIDFTKSYVQKYPDKKDYNFIKKALRDKKDFFNESTSYMFNDEIDSYYSDYIYLPKNYKKIRFTNSSTKRLHFRDDSNFAPYPFQSYVIAKKSNKYGIWDIEENKIIVPFNYKKIIIKNEHKYNNTYRFLLKQNGLYTSYPNVGLKPKYKYLGDYIGNYARFEYPSGEKGWVDYIGREYIE